jgi:hypothetical protein
MALPYSNEILAAREVLGYASMELVGTRNAQLLMLDRQRERFVDPGVSGATSSIGIEKSASGRTDAPPFRLELSVVPNRDRRLGNLGILGSLGDV